MFSHVLEPQSASVLSLSCEAAFLGDLMSWDDIISKDSLAPYLRETACDGGLSTRCFVMYNVQS